ncbi:helix-turn-helix domain-containing protein [Streptomyces sp. NPDC050625]|uniref:IclR family transcriptional regulator n=1 Tax=Streptomyces sp. NPDC050625 TaxID=3154629 RepID=UPI00342691EA
MSTSVTISRSRADNDHSGVRAIDKILALYALLRTADGPMRLSDLSRQAGLAKSTTHRLLGALVAAGMVVRFGTGYLVALTGGRETVPARSGHLFQRLAPFVTDLFMHTRLTSSLATLDGADVVFVHRVYGHDHVWTPSDDTGRSCAFHAAAGRLLLAHDLLSTCDVAEAWELAADEAASLNRDLMRIRRQGFAVAEGDGITYLAVPVPTRTDQLPVALAVQGRTDAVDPTHALCRLRLIAQAAGRAVSPRPA